MRQTEKLRGKSGLNLSQNSFLTSVSEITGPAHARARPLLAPAPSARHIPKPMAGSSLKRARKQGVRLDDGSIVAFPYMPRVADLPPGWRHFTTAQKIEHLIGLDRVAEILSWGPITDLDPLRLSFQMQVMRIMLRNGLKPMLDGTLGREAARERDRESVIANLAREFRRGIPPVDG